MVYHLPRTVLEITVRKYRNSGDGRIWYSLGGPKDLSAVDPRLSDVNGANDIVSHQVPDPRHRYVIQYHPSVFSDDRLCISRKPNGLLHDVQFAADDRTPEIVFNIARFIGGFIGSPVSFGVAPATPPHELVRHYTGRVDPFSDTEIASFNNALRGIFGEDLKLDFSRMREVMTKTANALPGGPDAHWSRACDPDHICYRTKVKLPVHLKQRGQGVDVKYADVMSVWDVGTISVKRAFLVQKITKLRFEDGALAAAILRKPSEVEEVSLLPINVMNAILSVPSGLWNAAFADNDFKQKTMQALAKQNAEIAKLDEKHQDLMLHGGGPTDFNASSATERYQLNCVAPARSDGAINILNPPSPS